MRIDPRHLRHLLAIAEHGTFRKASVTLGISQPALSASIGELERQVGVTVLERGRGGTELNEMGRLLTRRARELSSLMRETHDEVLQKKLGQDGPLTIGITPSMSNMVATALGECLAGRQISLVNVIAGLEGQLLTGLEAGEFDFVLGPLPDIGPAPPHIAEEMLLTDPIVIFLSPNNPLASRSSVRLEELCDLLWLIPVQASPFHELMSSLFKAAALPWPSRAIRTNSLAFGEELVVRLDAVMLGSQLHLATGSPCRVVPLESVAQRRIGLRYRRTAEPTPIAAAVMEKLRAGV